MSPSGMCLPMACGSCLCMPARLHEWIFIACDDLCDVTLGWVVPGHRAESTLGSSTLDGHTDYSLQLSSLVTSACAHAGVRDADHVLSAVPGAHADTQAHAPKVRLGGGAVQRFPRHRLVRSLSSLRAPALYTAIPAALGTY